MYKPNVLILDNDPNFQSVMTELLAERMNLVFVKNYSETITKLKNEEYSMVISETDIPDIHVVELIKKVKRLNPGIYIVVITSKEDLKLAVEVLQNGAIDYILKPFSVDEIAFLVEKYLKFSVNKKQDYDLLSLTTEEKRSFSLPSNIHLIGPFVYELVEMVKRFGGVSKSHIFSIRLALYEMLTNAIEHGNLDIDYEKKKSLLNSGANYMSYIESRSKEEPYVNKRVEISYHYQRDHITFHIKDQGKGFNVKGFFNKDIKKDLLALHGRGIVITKFNMDEITFNQKGNEVFLKKFLST